MQVASCGQIAVCQERARTLQPPQEHGRDTHTQLPGNVERRVAAVRRRRQVLALQRTAYVAGDGTSAGRAPGTGPTYCLQDSLHPLSSSSGLPRPSQNRGSRSLTGAPSRSRCGPKRAMRAADPALRCGATAPRAAEPPGPQRGLGWRGTTPAWRMPRRSARPRVPGNKGYGQDEEGRQRWDGVNSGTASTATRALFLHCGLTSMSLASPMSLVLAPALLLRRKR